MAKHTYYFKHDFNAHNDEKIVDLLMSHGLLGYGVFWYLIELLASADEYQLETNYKRLAFSARADEKVLKSVVEDFSLFAIDGDKFFSKSLADRMNKLDEIKAKRVEFGRKGGKAKANAKQKPSKTEANAKQNQAEESKGEESKGEERTEENSKEEKLLARELAFYESLKVFISEYSKETIRDFYDYWREPNKSNSKMRFESEKTWSLQLRLSRWANSNFNSSKSDVKPSIHVNPDKESTVEERRLRDAAKVKEMEEMGVFK
jgi:hypothetical protein